MSAINASEVLIEMIEKFIEIRKYIMNFKVTQAYELTKQQCLEYGKFKKGKTTTETTELDDKHDQVLKSVFAGLRLILFFLKVIFNDISKENIQLCLFVLQIKTGITNIDNLDLKEVKSLIIEAFHRKEFLHVVRLASELLSQIFQSANNLSTSRVFLILAVESFQMINLNMKLTEDFLDELDLELIIPDQALLGAKLNAELQFLTKLFAVSRKNKKIKHSGNSERDISFYKILKEMQV